MSKKLGGRTLSILMVSKHIYPCPCPGRLILVCFSVCHAAINAILNKNAENLEGCTLYTTLFPGHEDVKMIIQSGIKKVVFYHDKDQVFAEIARSNLETAKIFYTRYSIIINCRCGVHASAL